MRFLFDLESPVMRFLSRLADIMILNVVFLLTCIPIFTIGAAVTALYDVVFRMDTDREGKLLATYFRSFRGNFKPAAAIWLVLLLFGAATVVNMAHLSEIGGIFGYILVAATMLILVVLVMICSYAFPLLSQFDNSAKGTARNAFLLSVAYLPRTAVILVINCFPWVLMVVNLYTFAQLSLLWLFLYFSAAAYFNSRVLNKVFKPYWEQGKERKESV